jgi:hypothetical protein
VDRSSEMYGAATREDGGGHPVDAEERGMRGGIL